MHFTSQHLVALAAALPSVAGHGFVTGVKANGGTWYPGFDIQLAYQHPHAPVYGWDTAALDSGFVSPDSFATADIICHKSATPAALHVPVVAGQTVTLYWSNSWPSGHKGPVLDYLAPCAGNDCSTVDKTTLKFAKFDQVGLISGPAPGTWGEDQLAAANNSWTVTIPSTLKPGAYVLRHEILALHSARTANGAQSYPQCVNLMVSGGGSVAVNGASPETFYSETDPGILIDIYNGLNSYTIPGPAVQNFGAGGSGGSTPTSAAPGTTMVTTTKPATTSVAKPTTTSTSAKPTTSASTSGATAPLYGQCGGTGWTGPTTCASGTCKASGSYYSQCLP